MIKNGLRSPPSLVELSTTMIKMIKEQFCTESSDKDILGSVDPSSRVKQEFMKICTKQSRLLLRKVNDQGILLSIKNFDPGSTGPLAGLAFRVGKVGSYLGTQS